MSSFDHYLYYVISHIGDVFVDSTLFDTYINFVLSSDRVIIMALNRYQWDLYMLSKGKDTVQHFKSFLNSNFDEYADFIKGLIKKFCPDDFKVEDTYLSVLDAIDEIKDIRQTLSDNEFNELDIIRNGSEPLKDVADYEDDPYVSEWNQIIENCKPREIHTQFYKFIWEMVYNTQIKAFYYPSIFFPFYFQGMFNVLYSIGDMFQITLPPIPGKTQYAERIRYYGKLCNAFYQFAVDNQLSPIELWAFLYDYAPSCLGGTSWISQDIPNPRSVFVFGYGPRYPEKNKDAKWIWQGSPDMQIGDIGVLYHWAPDKCFTSVWRAISPGFYDPLGVHDRYVCYGYPIEIPHITIKDLREDNIFKETALVKQNMLRMDGAPLLPSEYMHLLEMAEKKGALPDNVPVLNLSTSITHGELLLERDVEDQLLEPLLRRLGWNPENWCRQMPVRIGRGVSKYPDYVINPVYTKNNERGEIVLEAKLTIPNKKQLETDRGQAHSYAKLLGARAYVLVSKEGIWLAKNDDDFSTMFEYSWKDLEIEDVFQDVYKAIGNITCNKQKKK